MSNEPAIFKVEREYPQLNDFAINGVQIWPFFRMYVRFELLSLNSPDFVQVVPAKEVLSRKSRGFIKQKLIEGYRAFKTLFYYYKVFRPFHSIPGRKKYLVLSNQLEKKKFNGFYLDKLCTGIIESLGAENFLLLEDPQIRDRSEYVHKELPIIDTRDIDLYLLNQRNLKLKFTCGSLQELNGILSAIGVREITLDYFQYFFKRYRTMKSFFKRYRPNIFFTSCYSYYPYVLAARSCNVTTVELQHGIIAENHPGYYCPLELSSICNSEYVLTFGGNSFPTAMNCIYDVEKTYPVGNYYLELIQKSAIPGWWKDASEGYKYNIAVPTDYITEEELVDFVLAVAKEDPQICFHLVPRNGMKKELQESVSSFENIKVHQKASFQEIVRCCDFNTSTDSTCCLEALELGVPNLLYNIGDRASATFKDKVNPAYTWFINSAAEYRDILYSDAKMDPEEVKKGQTSTFAANYLENVKQAMKNIEKLTIAS